LRRRGRLDVAAARAGGEDLKEPDRHFSRTILERTLSDRAARIASDARHDVELRSIASVEELGLRSVLCVPLLGTGPEPRGALYLDNAMREGIFGADQLELAESFCAHAALAWEIAERRQEREALVGQLRAAKRRLEAELDVTRREAVERSADASGEFQGMVGRGPRMRELFRWIEAVAPTDLPVLITGESGAGKELVARAIHRSSRRSERPLVAENLGAVPGGLLESILFGHVKGAFTGADRRRAGLFELAHEGTLFLDEIGLLPLDLQSRLLRALQEGEVRPLGSDATVRVDVRVVAATNEDVRRAVGDGRFREDLYYRLQGAEVRVPPLRERTEDLPDLVARFLRKAAAAGAATSKVSREAMDRLAAYPWPGNVRELENEVRRAAALSAGRTIQVGDLSPQVRDCILLPSRGGDRPDRPVRTLAEAERDAILHAMSHFRGRRGKVAEALGVARSTLYLKLRELGYDR
ncbi:MAG: sigma-54-dependent Fis family transcriptional regulator, partial [Candidatus Methanoperedens sp.]|nr:sigma-54-dependent Fis family transcriptional regulator [Candidatus Methanoperedens sp.]